MTVISRLILGVLLLSVGVSAQSDYTIGVQDVITIAVYDQADLTGKFTVDADGSLTFPLVGRFKEAPTAFSAILRSRPPWRRTAASASS